MFQKKKSLLYTSWCAQFSLLTQEYNFIIQLYVFIMNITLLSLAKTIELAIRPDFYIIDIYFDKYRRL